MKTTAVVLAAGQGTRMHSYLPKVLHPLLGRPLASYSLDAARQATGEQPVAVIGHGADQVRQALGDSAEFVLQEEQLGTAHAVGQAESLLRDVADLVLVTAADMPLLTSQTLEKLIRAQQTHPGRSHCWHPSPPGRGLAAAARPAWTGTGGHRRVHMLHPSSLPSVSSTPESIASPPVVVPAGIARIPFEGNIT
jgi:bifunctional UDP-N-acetylglucosamine pyrophosphorylase/glucosamine-1-phosphate N-acetyltransferase